MAAASTASRRGRSETPPRWEAATAANAVDEIDFDWYHTQADGSVTAENDNYPTSSERPATRV